MDNNIIFSLKKFEKFDKDFVKDFVKDKDCLICLESFDTESFDTESFDTESFDTESLNKLVKLPCNCNNSVYHIKCIVRFLQSGINKNFCPHCKKEYYINQHNNGPINQELQNEENNDVNRENNIVRPELLFTYLFHIITNTFLNIFNIAISTEYKNNKKKFISDGLLILFYIKLLLNCYIIMKVKDDKTKIQDYLYYSYVFQILIFSLLVYFYYITSTNINSVALLINNIIFCLGDLLYRLNIHYKILRRINEFVMV
jgi:hypothetical protein